ncbi:putative somatostatin receptor type 4-like [Apostichopus japonicus]|nr:putative somatostatin receptor type 4-like [Apostichopus japonicus]
MHQYYEDRIACGLNYERIGSTEVVATVHIVYMAMIGFFIPLVIIAVCYTLIVVRLRIVSIRTGKMEKSRKVNRLVLGVVLVFIACWGPFYTLRFIFALYSQITYVLQPATKYLFNLTLTIGYINSCANCFLYAFLSESFKKSFQAAWFCTRSRDINSDLTNSSGYVLRGGRRERMLRKEMDKLGCFRKWSKLRTDDGKFDDDNYLSGVQHNSYPLTSLTTAVSDACRSQE